ncbi:hypothetical protein EV702DRAFT_1078338 [Suillus placidus]|uniref:Uncharacterized protein n=1 Tax=Suillus placidus TaxID=48579 RepID=A0A9P7A2G3_9AGAM|nr:hypothetical protein EV702DRAFT_1078338 [Suillus placidus]
MRFSFVLAVVAALTASVSVASMPTTGSELNSATCPFFCFTNSACDDCGVAGLPWMRFWLSCWEKSEADYTR